MSKEKDGCKIGIVGTGFIATGLYNLLLNSKRWRVEQVLTRRRIDTVDGFKTEVLTNSPEELITRSDIIVECSGDVIHATDVISESMKNKRPVVTMDAEFQVTCGHFFASKGYITEAEGDQPGCLAALNKEVRQMGFKPVVYANIKGFTNLNPTLEEMNYWSAKNGIRLEQTVAFTDTTKIEIEQALVANGLGAAILPQGILGLACDDLKEGGIKLAEKALEFGQPISDYLLSQKLPPGIFIVATMDKIHSSVKYPIIKTTC